MGNQSPYRFLTGDRNHPIRVLLVEDSPVALALLKRSLARHPEILVVGSAGHGQHALDMIQEVDPQVICTDLHMPVMDGLEFTRRVMEEFPRPILVVSVSIRQEDTQKIFQLFEAGALDFFPKPMSSWLGSEGAAFSLELSQRIRLLADAASCPSGRSVMSGLLKLPDHAVPAVNVVVIGGSLGGPMVLKEIVSQLPSWFSAPILCIQHLDREYQEGLVNWLRQHTAMPVQFATHGEIPLAGSFYLPPPDHHLILDERGGMVLSRAPLVEGVRPSITLTMESAAARFGSTVVGVLLSGTGRDGVRGMEAITMGGGTTLVQDEESCLAFDLPWQVIELGAANYILPCAAIAHALVILTGCQDRPPQHQEWLEPALANDKGSISLLIVEDSPTQLLKLQRALQQAGYRVAAARDGMEGLEKAKQEAFHLVISDVSMPRMDGFELCRTIKQDASLCHLPVMLLTALTSPGEILEGLGAGADNYLTKPWEEGYLLDRVDNLLQLVRVADKPELEQPGIAIEFEGRRYLIGSTRRQILNLLLSTYQKAVQQNRELTESQMELKMLNLQLVEQTGRLGQLNRQLQDEIRERQLVEERRQRLVSELEGVNRELADFAYIISHDLKSPLRAMGSIASWLSSDYADKLDEGGRDLVLTLGSRAHRINGLIDALLEYTKISRINEVLEEVDLAKLVYRLIEEFKLPEEMEILYQPALPVIRFDRRRARQIFFHLIGNAVQFMDKTAGEIRLGWEDQGDFLLFMVMDNGPGIDPRYHEKIFGIFQTLQPRDQLETAGIGLALVRKIVTLYGGTITVDSEEGRGSCFRFTLPKRPEESSPS